MSTDTTPEPTSETNTVAAPPESATSGDPKRDELRAKIEASERRIAQRTMADQAKDAANAATDYVRQNPLTVVGGAIAVGLVIGAMTPAGRRVARTAAAGAASAVSGASTVTAKGAVKSVKTTAKKSGSAVGSLVSDSILAYAIKLIDEAMEAGRAGKEAAEDFGDSATAKARTLRRDANYMAGSAADKGVVATRKTRRRAARAVRSLTDRVSK